VAEGRQLELDGAYAEAEKLASAKREAREALAAQMQAIEEKRKIEKKEREEECLALLAQFQSYEDQDATIQREKKTQMANLREDVLRANAEAIKARSAALAQEKEEMAELLRYQNRKDAELEAREKEEAARVHAKKMWQMQILSQQEKGRSDKARLEERRLLRAAEMKEAATCRLEQENALRRKQGTLALKKELLRQAQAKKMRAEEDAFTERLETEVNDSYEDKIKNQELAEQAKKASLNKSHLEALKHQVQEAESRRRAERARRFEEGRKLKMKAEEELANLEGIRGRLIEGLEAKGVASKYLAHIRRAKLTPV
jgi:colicin import membrane protein